MSRILGPTKVAMLVTDIGFLLYWAVAFAHVIPPELAYKDYTNPILSSWNFSFVALDLLASATGLASLCRIPGARTLMTVSLTLTSAAGLQAIMFWALRCDFSLTWWVPNLFLLLFPIPALFALTRESRPLAPAT
ncbi:YvaD family protein [Nocardia sp. CDC159]|uniref:YvaD family protein n=1 Tax=Nocardia pulmonis TaxID=2951408 RepID=A0A9X2E4X3_9NOCA|nr:MULTISPECIES: DUF5360 family protein [Nocardia]MCM6773691.1 YvaD family protein [Nocardia pulmonis]MCM6786578.1 YvaD family protein [Nocardia sp. CDC159]